MPCVRSEGLALEVDQPHPFVGVDDDVRSLEVAHDQAVVVDLLQRAGQLDAESRDLDLGQVPSRGCEGGQSVPQGLAADLVLGQEDVVAVVDQGQQGRPRALAQPGQGGGLGP